MCGGGSCGACVVMGVLVCEGNDAYMVLGYFADELCLGCARGEREGGRGTMKRSGAWGTWMVPCVVVAVPVSWS